MAVSTISKLEIPTVPTFTVSEVSVDNISISGGDSYEGSVSAAKSGYTPLGIVGVVISNATSSGTGYGFSNLIRFYLSGNNVTFRVLNPRENAIKIKIAAKVLYLSN